MLVQIITREATRGIKVLDQCIILEIWITPSLQMDRQIDEDTYCFFTHHTNNDALNSVVIEAILYGAWPLIANFFLLKKS